MRASEKILACWLAVPIVLGTVNASDVETIDVPGGAETLARYYGLADVAPDELATAINAVLLDSVRRGEPWSAIPERQELVDYLDTIAAITRRFSQRITLSGSADLYVRYVELAHELGYQVAFDSEGPVLEPRVGERLQSRRDVADALGWDVTRIGRRLARNETVELNLEEGRIPPPCSLDLWSGIVGATIEPARALRQLAEDPSASLMIEGARRLDRETAGFFRENRLLPWLYDQAPVRFYRYASALRVREGELVVPGGDAAREAWADLVGAAPDSPIEFVQQLLRRRDGRVAYLWHSLFFQDEATTAFWVLTERKGKRDRSRLAELFLGIEGIAASADWSAARGNGPGLPTLMRVLPVDLEERRLALPGGAGLWSKALTGSELPAAHELGKLAAKWGAQELSDTEFLRRALGARVEIGPFQRPVLPRLTGTVRLFGERVDLLSPENVILLNRTIDRFPMALATLPSLEATDPATIRDYLLAVARLEELPHGPRKSGLLAGFQGGVELLAALWRNGTADSSLLERRLQEWGVIHQTETSAESAAPRQLAWLAALVNALPTASDDFPGRGPLERALLQALVPRRDPQTFRWKGIDYRGSRRREIAATYAAILEIQAIPSADQLAGIERNASELEAAMSAADPDRTSKLARELSMLVAELPPAELDTAVEPASLGPWFGVVDRSELLSVPVRIAELQPPERLPKNRHLVERLRRQTASDLRAFLLAPAYLPALAGLSDSLLGSSVIRKHSPVRSVESATAILGDSAWDPTTLLPGRLSHAGTLLSGHLGQVCRPLADYRFVVDTTNARVPVVEQLRVWFDDAVSTPWHELTPSLSAEVAVLVAAGSDVPSPADRLWIGLVAAGGAADAIRERLAVAGAATPALDGNGRRSIRPWPPYEALESEGDFQAMVERQLIDLRLSLIAYLGRRQLPGEVGADLMERVLHDLPARIRLRTRLDWRSFLETLQSMDDNYFDEKFRECLTDGLYSAQGF